MKKGMGCPKPYSKVNYKKPKPKEGKMSKLEVDKSISIGHVVNVHFGKSSSIFNAKVLYEPQATGDSWILDTEQGVVYVQIFERMDLIG
jgi:hypothetical protein